MRMQYLSLSATWGLVVTSAAMAQPVSSSMATKSTTVATAPPTTLRPSAATGPTLKGAVALPATQTIGRTQSISSADVRATGMGGPTGINAHNGGRAGVREGDDEVDTERGVSYSDGSSATVSPNGSERVDLTPQSTDPGPAPADNRSILTKAFFGAAEATGGMTRDPQLDPFTRTTERAVAGVRGTPDERPTFGTNTLKGPPTGGAGGDPKDTGTNGTHGVSAANGATVNLGNRAGGDAAPAAPKPPEAFDTGKLLKGASDPIPH